MAKTVEEFVKGVIATILGYMAWFLGGFDGLIIALLVFMAIDYITGVMIAIHNKKIDSKVGFKGICKKVLILLFVGMSSILDTYVIGGNSPIREVVASFYIANEGISIIENAAKLGLPVPKRLVDILAQLRGKEENKE